MGCYKYYQPFQIVCNVRKRTESGNAMVAVRPNAEKFFKKENINTVIGIDGDSLMDTVRVIVVASAHPGTDWDYLFYKKQPTKATLPVICVSTTLGAVFQKSKVSALINTEEECKSAMSSDNLLAKVAVVTGVFNKVLNNKTSKEVACAFKYIDLYYTLDDLGMSKNYDVEPTPKHAMEFPNSKANPRVTAEEDMHKIYMRSFEN